MIIPLESAVFAVTPVVGEGETGLEPSVIPAQAFLSVPVCIGTHYASHLHVGIVLRLG